MKIIESIYASAGKKTLDIAIRNAKLNNLLVNFTRQIFVSIKITLYLTRRVESLI